MPLPGDVTTLTLTGTYKDAQGTPLVGTVTFTPAVTLAAQADGLTLLPAPITVTIGPGANGAFSVVLPCTDATALLPSGWTYTVWEQLGYATGGGRTPYGRIPYSISLPSSLAPTVDIDRVAPVTPYIPPSVAGGDLSGTYPNPQVVGLHGAPVPAAPGGTSAFLRADRTWASPPGGGITPPVGDIGGTVLVPTVVATHLSAPLPVAQGGTGSITQNFLGLGGDVAGGTVTAPQVTGTHLASPLPIAQGGTASSATPLTGTVPVATSGTTAAWEGAAGVGPWIVTPQMYGAKGDGKAVGDGAMTASSAVLTSATAGFTSADVGKAVMVKGAAVTGVTTLVTTISAYTSATQVTLAATASTTVTGAVAMWGTDDSAAFQAAINAATAYAVAHGAGAEVFIPAPAASFYAIAGSLQTGATKGNAQLTLPIVTPTGAQKVSLTIRGIGQAAAETHWQQTLPPLTGSTLVSFGVFSSTTAQINSINANGNAAVIGGPNQQNGYGTSALLFSNMCVMLKDFSILTTHSSFSLTYGAWDFSGLGQAAVIDHSYSTATTYASGDYLTPSGFSAGLCPGALLPAAGNNDLNVLRNVTCGGGYTYSLFATEHTVANRLCLLYSWSALCPVGSYYFGAGASHGIFVDQVSIEGCINHLYFIGQGQSGIGPDVVVEQLDTESAAPTVADNNSGAGVAAATGTIRLAGLFTQANIALPGPTSLKVISGQQPTGYVAPPSYSLGTAFRNPWWRDALVSVSGGTVTGVKVGATLGGSTAPTMHATGLTSGSFLLPAGGWLEIDGSVAPTLTPVLI